MEVIITIVWIAYGCFSAYQLSNIENQHDPLVYIVFAAVAPLILAIRLMMGIFSKRIFITPEE